MSGDIETVPSGVETSAISSLGTPLAPSEEQQFVANTSHGSSVVAVIFNFTNCIIGAGAIGLGGAMALSGGIVSMVTIAFFGLLTKISLDLVIELSVKNGHSSYEDLGKAAFGWTGRWIVVAAKFCYSFGCLVAYIVVVKDNFGPAIRTLIGSSTALEFETATAWSLSSLLRDVLESNAWLTWCVSTFIILPLCLLRDMTPLSGLSTLSILAMASIVAIIMYLYFFNPHGEIRHDGGSFYERWIEIRWGYLENCGTFVFTFVSQHTVHLAFGSLKPQLRTLENWRKISTVSLLLSASVSLTVALFVYMSFWDETKSDIFEIYPAIPVIDLAKLLLCITMILTFPLPFFTCRELIIVSFFPASPLSEVLSVPGGDLDDIPDGNIGGEVQSQLREPLLQDGGIEGDNYNENSVVSIATDGARGPTESLLDISSVLSTHAVNIMNSCLLPDDERQLRLPYHIVMTCKLWFVATGLAIAAPNLGDVLDLVGCASGTIIAFVFPASVALRLNGFSVASLLILIIGGLVGVVGTYFSLQQLYDDIM